MTDIALREWENRVTQFEPITQQRRELLKRTICRDLSDDEMDLFVAVCNRRRLDPFVKQIHAVKRRQKNAKTGEYEEVMVIQTGIDGFRLVAERTLQRDGVDGPWWCGPDGEWRDVWLTGSWPAAAKVVVYRKGHARGYTGIAHWEEYVETYKDKQGNWVPNYMWAHMPAGQLAKCAEALAWRKAFPEELGGIYTDDEMGQAEESAAGVVTTQPAPAVAATYLDHGVPTLDEVKGIKSVQIAKALIQEAAPEFQALIPKAILAVYHADPHAWWETTTAVKAWKQVLEYAVELHEQQQHETSAGGALAPPGPAAGTQSGRGRAEQTPGEGRQDSATTPRPDNPDDGGTS